MAAKKSKNDVLGFLNATVLFAYNVVQLIGWSCVAWKLFLVATEKSEDTFEAAYSATSLLVISLQQFSCLELLLSVAGILPSPLVNVLMQLTARNSVILVAVQFTSSASVLESPAIFITFIAWSIAEIARYSWLLGKTFPDSCAALNRFLTWVRYNMFLVLYPLGAVGEGWTMWNAMQLEEVRTLKQVVCQGIQELDENVCSGIGDQKIALRDFIKYMYFPLFIPGFLFLYFHMLKQRSKKLKSSTVDSKNAKPKMD